MAALIVAMVALSIAGSAWWRPQPSSRETLPLGGALPVRNAPRLAGESISSVLETVGPTLAFLTVPEFARSGSGVVVHEDGFVVTNAHVVEGADELLVAFDDGEEYHAVVYGIDPSTDLAVVKVDADRPLPAAPLGNSDELRVGEFVVALGAPFGLEATATSGIVSGLHRSGLGITRFEDFVVTDAPINRGNSGGPLVNLRGEVVGINTAIIADDAPRGMGTFSGVGFAIPVNVMRVVAQRLIGDGGGRPGSPATPGAGTGDIGGPGSPLVSNDGGRRAPSHGRSDPPFGRGAHHLVPIAARSTRDALAIVQTFDSAGVRRQVGTGFFVGPESDPVLVTNAHVVQDARMVYVFLPGSAPLSATVIIADAARDLALVRVPEATGVATLELGDSNTVVVGSPVNALGARYGDGQFIVDDHRGVVTGLDVVVDGVATGIPLIETTAATERGDSGGPLMNEQGSVVGVMVARDREPRESGESRRSYAVPLVGDTELNELLDEAALNRFDAGFTGAVANAYILVIHLDPDGPAAGQGLRLYDRIVAIDGEPFASREAASDAYLLWRQKPSGTRSTLTIQRATAEDPDKRTEFPLPYVIPDRSREP